MVLSGTHMTRATPMTRKPQDRRRRSRAAATAISGSHSARSSTCPGWWAGRSRASTSPVRADKRGPAAVRARHRGGHAEQLLRAPALCARAGDQVPGAGRTAAAGPHQDQDAAALRGRIRAHRGGYRVALSSRCARRERSSLGCRAPVLAGLPGTVSGRQLSS